MVTPVSLCCPWKKRREDTNRPHLMAGICYRQSWIYQRLSIEVRGRLDIRALVMDDDNFTGKIKSVAGEKVLRDILRDRTTDRSAWFDIREGVVQGCFFRLTCIGLDAPSVVRTLNNNNCIINVCRGNNPHEEKGGVIALRGRRGGMTRAARRCWRDYLKQVPRKMDVTKGVTEMVGRALRYAARVGKPMKFEISYEYPYMRFRILGGLELAFDSRIGRVGP